MDLRGDVAGELPRRDGADVSPLELNLPGRRVGEAGDQSGDRRFPRAAFPDDPEALALGEVEIDISRRRAASPRARPGTICEGRRPRAAGLIAVANNGTRARSVSKRRGRKFGSATRLRAFAAVGKPTGRRIGVENGRVAGNAGKRIDVCALARASRRSAKRSRGVAALKTGPMRARPPRSARRA